MGWRVRWILGILPVLSPILGTFEPAFAPPLVAMVLLYGVRTIRQAWRGAGGTALRGALTWLALAVSLGVAAQGLAMVEPLAMGRPWAGRMTYVMALCVLAFLISVLNARNPGSGAWALLMALMVLVFLIPWLEGVMRLRPARGMAVLQLHSPWTLFYGLLVVAGVTNFLPTRHAVAATLVGVGLVLEYLGMTRTSWPPEWRARLWLAVAWAFGAALWAAGRSGSRPLAGRNGMERRWFWFRDHWGVVWALRIQERFNRSAADASWPFRLTWYGLVPACPDGPPLEATSNELAEAETTFLGLIRRFVGRGRLDRLDDAAEGRSCDPGTVPR